MRFLLLITFLITHFVSAQGTLDSLTEALKDHPKEDTVRVMLLNALSFRVFKNQPEESLHFAEQALALAQRLSFQKGIGEAKNNLAVYHLMRGHTDSSLKLALEGASIAEREGLKDLEASSYSILGTIYQSQIDYPKALDYLTKAEKLTSNALTLSKVFNAMGSIARHKKKYDSALFYYNKALAVMMKAKEEYRVPEVTNNIGIVYSRQNKTALALEYHLKALNVARKIDNRRGQAQALTSLGYNYLDQKKYSEAEKFLLESAAISKGTGDNGALSDAYMALMQLKNETGKFNEAHVYMINYYDLRDSLLSAEKTRQIAEMEVRYETEKKDYAIQLLERDQKINRLWSNILISVLVMLIILSIVFYYLQRYREQKNRQILNLEIDKLTTQHKELSEKYKNAMRSSDDASIDSLDQRILKKAIEVVESNIGDASFDIDRMAKEMGMSRTNMNRKIKEITGFPPNELIRSIRLRKAAVMLLNQADSVSQISFAVGYEDHSYFSKIFKKYFGVPPSEYLQSKKGNESPEFTGS